MPLLLSGPHLRKSFNLAGLNLLTCEERDWMVSNVLPNSKILGIKFKLSNPCSLMETKSKHLCKNGGLYLVGSMDGDKLIQLWIPLAEKTLVVTYQVDQSKSCTRKSLVRVPATFMAASWSYHLAGHKRPLLVASEQILTFHLLVGENLWWKYLGQLDLSWMPWLPGAGNPSPG